MPSAGSSASAATEPLGGPAPFDAYQWRQSTIEVDQYGFVIDVASAPFGWVAVGVQTNFPGPDATFAPGVDPFANLYSGVVWTSSDGLTWAKHPGGPEFAGARITDVVGTATGALAFGIGGVCLPDACSGLPPNGGTIVWSSADGTAWERVGDTGLEDGALLDVIQTDDGFVAVGYVANDGSKPDTDSFSNPTDAVVWRSVDGRHWAVVEDLPVSDQISMVSADGSTLVAIGSKDYATITWISDDGGATWKVGPSIGEECCLSSTTARGDSMVSVTFSDDDEQAVNGIVRTADATSTVWTTSSPPEMVGFRPASAQVLGTSYVAFGWTSQRDSDGLMVDTDHRAYASQEGDVWEKVDLPAGWDGLAPIAAANRGRDMVAVLAPLDTFNGPPEETVSTVWLGTAPD